MKNKMSYTPRDYRLTGRRNMSGLYCKVLLFSFFLLHFSLISVQAKDGKDGKDGKGDRKAFTIAKSLNVFNSVVRELKMLYVDDFDYEKSVNTAIDAMLEDLDLHTKYVFGFVGQK